MTRNTASDSGVAAYRRMVEERDLNEVSAVHIIASDVKELRPRALLIVALLASIAAGLLWVVLAIRG